MKSFTLSLLLTVLIVTVGPSSGRQGEGKVLKFGDHYKYVPESAVQDVESAQQDVVMDGDDPANRDGEVGDGEVVIIVEPIDHPDWDGVHRGGSGGKGLAAKAQQAGCGNMCGQSLTGHRRRPRNRRRRKQRRLRGVSR